MNKAPSHRPLRLVCDPLVITGLQAKILDSPIALVAIKLLWSPVLCMEHVCLQTLAEYSSSSIKLKSATKICL